MGLASAVRGWGRRRDSVETRRPWREVEYAVVDLETTGLNLRTDCIASYGVAVVREGRVAVADNIYGLVRPDCALSPAAMTIHHLLPGDLAAAPALASAVPVLAAALDNRVLVAHAAWIEKAFLTRAFAEHGHRLRVPIIDTAALARAVGLQSANCRGEPNLEVMAIELGLPVVSPHHALGDATTTAIVFLALAARLQARGYASARELVDLSAADRGGRR